MTPLAQRIARELTMPMAKRSFIDGESAILGVISDVHCFEISQAWAIVDEMAKQLHDRSIVGGIYGPVSLDERLAFLPAPLTWIEWSAEDRERVGVLIEEFDPGKAIISICTITRKFFGCAFQLPLKLTGGSEDLSEAIYRPSVPWTAGRQFQFQLKCYAALALINTPRIIGRRQHMPHAGLERDLARAKGMVGKYPLHAWTEIKLEVTAPVVDEGEPQEAHLTGAKALHFCRQHLRIRLGRLEMVRAHWRGDPAIGIKRSRYVVVPPHRGVSS